jgi:hypothetical protein
MDLGSLSMGGEPPVTLTVLLITLLLVLSQFHRILQATCSGGDIPGH